MRMSGFWTATKAAHEKLCNMGLEAALRAGDRGDGAEVPEGFRKVQRGNAARKTIVGLETEPDVWVDGMINPYYS